MRDLYVRGVLFSACAGCSIDRAAAEAVNLVRVSDTTIILEFNGKLLKINGGMTIEAVVTEYSERCRRERGL